MKLITYHIAFLLFIPNILISMDNNPLQLFKEYVDESITPSRMVIRQQKNIGSDEVQYLSEKLTQNPSIQSVHLSNNNYEENYLNNFLEILSQHTDLTALTLNHQISLNGDNENISIALNKITQLRNLTIQAMPSFDHNIWSFIINNLYNNTILSSLELIHCELSFENLINIFNLLKSAHSGLTDLTLKKIGLNDSACEVLAENIKGNKQLVFLDISNNDIGDHGLNHLKEALPHSALDTLIICKNLITRQAISSFIEDSTNHLSMFFFENELLKNKEDISAIQQSIGKNYFLTIIESSYLTLDVRKLLTANRKRASTLVNHIT